MMEIVGGVIAENILNPGIRTANRVFGFSCIAIAARNVAFPQQVLQCRLRLESYKGAQYSGWALKAYYTNMERRNWMDFKEMEALCYTAISDNSTTHVAALRDAIAERLANEGVPVDVERTLFLRSKRHRDPGNRKRGHTIRTTPTGLIST